VASRSPSELVPALFRPQLRPWEEERNKDDSKNLLLHRMHPDCVAVLYNKQEVQSSAADDVESGGTISSHISTLRQFMKLVMSQVFAQSCVLTFLAEWGDRSQISTIILAARDVSSVSQ